MYCPEPDPSQICVEKGWEVMATSYRKGNSHGAKGGNSSQSGQMMEEGAGEVVVSLSLQIFRTWLYKPLSNGI